LVCNFAIYCSFAKQLNNTLKNRY